MQSCASKFSALGPAYLLLVVLLPASLGWGAVPQPTLTNGKTLRLLRANLHVHTRWSSPKYRVGNHGLRKPAENGLPADHVNCQPPLQTARAAHDEKLNVVGFSDHDCSLDPWEWGEKSYGESLLEAAEQCGQDPICLRGCEWTPEGTTNEHINVFGTERPVYARASSEWKDGDYYCPSLRDLYSWVALRLSAGGPAAETIVCQFNHPNRCTTRFDNLAFSRGAADAFCLMELGSGFSPAYSEVKDSERWYQLALRNGWQVAPTIGIDNQINLQSGAGNHYTGVWTEASSEPGIVAALRARRTFATETKGLELWFWGEMADGRQATMGESLAAGKDEEVALKVNLDSPAEIARSTIVEVASDGTVREHGLGSGATGCDLGETVTLGDNTVCYYVRLKARARNAKLYNYTITAPIWITTPTPTGDGGTAGVAVDLATSLVLDISGSMSESCPSSSGTKLDAAKDAVQRILRIVSNAARAFGSGVAPFGVVSFTDTAEEVQPVTPDLGVVANATAALQPMNGTNMADGLTKGFEQLDAQSGDRCIIILSDGLTNLGLDRATLMDAAADDNPVKQAADQGIRIYTVGFGNQIDEELLKQIAQMTGGEYYYADDGYTLSRMYVRICLSSRGDILLQQSGTITEGQTQLLDKIKVEYGRAGLSGVVTCLGSEVAPRIKDPSGKVVDEHYPGASIVHGNPSCVFVKNPTPGDWEVSAVGLECHGAEPFEAIVSAEKGKATGGSGGAVTTEDDLFTSLLVGSAVVVVLLLAVVVQRRRMAPVLTAPHHSRVSRWVIDASGPFDGRTSAHPASVPITIGRGKTNTIVLDDPQVSSHHAVLHPTPHGWQLADLGSRNGTFVDNARITTAELHGGEMVRLGSSTLTIRLVTPAER